MSTYANEAEKSDAQRSNDIRSQWKNFDPSDINATEHRQKMSQFNQALTQESRTLQARTEVNQDTGR